MLVALSSPVLLLFLLSTLASAIDTSCMSDPRLENARRFICPGDSKLGNGKIKFKIYLSCTYLVQKYSRKLA